MKNLKGFLQWDYSRNPVIIIKNQQSPSSCWCVWFQRGEIPSEYMHTHSLTQTFTQTHSHTLTHSQGLENDQRFIPMSLFCCVLLCLSHFFTIHVNSKSDRKAPSIVVYNNRSHIYTHPHTHRFPRSHYLAPVLVGIVRAWGNGQAETLMFKCLIHL